MLVAVLVGLVVGALGAAVYWRLQARRELDVRLDALERDAASVRDLLDVAPQLPRLPARREALAVLEDAGRHAARVDVYAWWDLDPRGLSGSLCVTGVSGCRCRLVSEAATRALARSKPTPDAVRPEALADPDDAHVEARRDDIGAGA